MPPSKDKPTLSHSQACDRCRSRKVRCDARRPRCTSCEKYARTLGISPDKMTCNYRVGSKSASDSESGSQAGGEERKIEELENRIAFLEQIILNQDEAAWKSFREKTGSLLAGTSRPQYSPHIPSSSSLGESTPPNPSSPTFPPDSQPQEQRQGLFAPSFFSSSSMDHPVIESFPQHFYTQSQSYPQSQAQFFFPSSISASTSARPMETTTPEANPRRSEAIETGLEQQRPVETQFLQNLSELDSWLGSSTTGPWSLPPTIAPSAPPIIPPSSSQGGTHPESPISSRPSSSSEFGQTPVKEEF